MARIVLFSFPTQGRLIPVMSLASCLASLGAQVSLLSFMTSLARMQEAASRTSTAGITFVRLKPEDEDDEADVIQSSFDTLDSLQDKAPDCVIADEMCAEISAVVRELGITRYIFCPQSALSLAFTLYAPLLNSEGRIPFPSSKKNLRMPVPGIPNPVPPHACYFEHVPADLIKVMLDGAAEAREADGIFVNTLEVFEHTTLQAIRQNEVLNPKQVPIIPVTLVQQAVSQNGRVPPRHSCRHSCIDFLDRQQPSSVVHISFGSIVNPEASQVQHMAAAIEASGVPFIWMLRSNTSALPEGFLSRTEATGIVTADWIPQLQVLSHPSTGAFFTHCGWNSTIESLSLGVPMITAPAFMDQPMNCQVVVEELKVGVQVSLEDARVVENGLKEVFKSQEIRKRAEHLKAAASEGVSTTRDNLSRFLDTLQETRQHCVKEV